MDAGRDDRQAEQHGAQGQIDGLDREPAQQDRERAHVGDVGDVAPGRAGRNRDAMVAVDKVCLPREPACRAPPRAPPRPPPPGPGNIARPVMALQHEARARKGL